MKVEAATKVNYDDIKNRMYIDITGIPPQVDIYTVTPAASQMYGQDELVIVRTVVQIILQSEVDISRVVRA